MTKIRSLEIVGLRGVKHTLSLKIDGRSTLLYGDNGAGKSTVADAIEWFFTDKVDHLKGEEIGRSGVEALRHIGLSPDNDASAGLNFSDDALSSTKTLSQKGIQLKSANSNSSQVFQDYLAQSQGENLMLRYRDLTRLVLATKTERLEALSAIIGYKDITATRDVLRNAYNGCLRDIKVRDFSRATSEYQQEIIQEYGQNITSDEQFLNVTAGFVAKLNIDIELKTLQDINVALARIGKPDNQSDIRKEAFLTRTVEQLVTTPAMVADIEEQYGKFIQTFSDIVSDVANFRKLLIGSVLKAASSLLGNDAYDADECPVCLTEANREELKRSVDERIEELAEIQQEQKKLSDSEAAIRTRVRELVGNLSPLLSDELANEEWFSDFKRKIQELIDLSKKYASAVDIRPASDAKIIPIEDLKLSTQSIEDLHEDVKRLRDDTRKFLSSDPRWEVYNKVNNAGRAYASIRRLNKERLALEAQRDTLELIYKEFSDRQREAIESFLGAFSGRIQEIYQYMNPGEKVENIKLVPIEKNDEMVGVTFQLDFLDYEAVSPPHKYLSESHLNCFGIAFFLASADAFNKKNKFLILDDVISSFDENHRKRFADLLVQKYGHYQLLVLTHERGWFELVRNLVRGRQWYIESLKHTEDRGTEIGLAPKDLRETIEAKVADRDSESLGGLARKYFERLLKEIALNLEVRVPFRFNDINEDRMCAELLSDLKAHLNRRKCKELYDLEVFKRLEGSMFIGNKDSHDGSFQPGFADVKAFWDDVCEFEGMFKGDKCGTYISMKYFDPIAHQIRCKSGELAYTWKS